MIKELFQGHFFFFAHPLQPGYIKQPHFLPFNSHSVGISSTFLCWPLRVQCCFKTLLQRKGQSEMSPGRTPDGQRPGGHRLPEPRLPVGCATRCPQQVRRCHSNEEEKSICTKNPQAGSLSRRKESGSMRPCAGHTHPFEGARSHHTEEGLHASLAELPDQTQGIQLNLNCMRTETNAFVLSMSQMYHNRVPNMPNTLCG